MVIGKIIKKSCLIVLVIIVLITLIVLILNFWVVLTTRKQIVDNYQDLEDIDCIIVLGAGVWKNKPSPMLQDRLNTAIDLYNSEVATKIIMSGDHGTKYYDEVNTMKNYAKDKGVLSSNIFMDHAGFSTYDSMYRAKHIFKAKKIVVVTQKYHLYRALYIANSLGLEAYGVEATPKDYSGQMMRELREILARDKDVFKSIVKPKSIYLGEELPVSGNGDITNDIKIEVKDGKR